MKTSDLKISISGIRGIVGQSLTPQLVIKFAEAFSTYIGGGDIAVASDTRPSGEMVKSAVFAGLLSCGASPLDLGILPIPSLQIYTKEHRLDGAISITASHNPVEWNALKLIKGEGRFLYPYEAEELLDFYYQGKFKRVEQPLTIRNDERGFQPHLKKIMGCFDLEAIRRRGFKAAVDPCGGAAAPYVSRFLSELGVDVVEVNTEITGTFPRNPEPLAENLTALSDAVKKSGADIGLAQDADADRLAAVDEKGDPIGEEYTLALAVEGYLQHRQRSPVVVNLSTSRIIEEIARMYKVELIRTKVGEINVARAMAQIGARIGGEGNGGIIVSDVHLCRDSFGGMALLLESLAKSGVGLSDLKRRLPAYSMIKTKQDVPHRKRKAILNRLLCKFPKGNRETSDGLRIDYPEFWFHVRPSNTEPVMRIIVEARDEETVQHVLAEIKEEI